MQFLEWKIGIKKNKEDAKKTKKKENDERFRNPNDKNWMMLEKYAVWIQSDWTY